MRPHLSEAYNKWWEPRRWALARRQARKTEKRLWIKEEMTMVEIPEFQVTLIPPLPEGFVAVPKSRLEFLQDRADFLEALEAAGLDNQVGLVEQAQEIMKEWASE